MENTLQRIKELEAEVTKWRTLAERDTLTGCLRREAFSALIEQRRKFGFLAKNMTVAIIDLDHFKKINDTHGHLTGDKVLEYLGQLLNEKSPEGTLICRMGGEEFVALLPGNLADNMEKLDTLRARIGKTSIQTSVREEIFVTASMGVADWNTDRPMNEALAKSDAALYRAKNQGRNRLAA